MTYYSQNYDPYRFSFLSTPLFFKTRCLPIIYRSKRLQAIQCCLQALSFLTQCCFIFICFIIIFVLFLYLVLFGSTCEGPAFCLLTKIVQQTKAPCGLLMIAEEPKTYSAVTSRLTMRTNLVLTFNTSIFFWDYKTLVCKLLHDTLNHTTSIVSRSQTLFFLCVGAGKKRV